MTEFTIVLQAGGKSSRMGTDKALVPFMGTTLLGYILEQITPLGQEILLISNDPPAFASFDLPVYSDIFIDWGALGGLHSAIYHAKDELCLVLACDMPFISTDFIRRLVQLADGNDAVIPRLAETGFSEPFRAVYSRRCLPAIERAIKNGQRRVNSFFDQVRVRYVEQPEIEELDPALQSFFNINTPDDLQTAERLAKSWRRQ